MACQFNSCPICGGDFRKAIFPPRTFFCDLCTVGFTSLNKKFEYSSSKSQELDPLFLDLAAKRDFMIYQKLISNLKDFEINNILEIGPGYGKLGLLISNNYPKVNYYVYEENIDLQNQLFSSGLKITTHNNLVLQEYDLIIMNNVLEHIFEFQEFLKDLKFKYIILYQPNPIGFIPKWLPHLWYGWSKNQHYWHFSPKSLNLALEKIGCRQLMQIFFKLPYKFNVDYKFPFKFMLAIINLFVKNSNCDAYAVIYKAD